MSEPTDKTDYDFEAYQNGTPQQRMMIIQAARMASTDPFQQGFFEGMMFADSIGLDSHPDGFAFGCGCDECLSCG